MLGGFFAISKVVGFSESWPLTFEDDTTTVLRYSEPAADLIPVKDRGAPFSAGGAPAEDQPPTGDPGA